MCDNDHLVVSGDPLHPANVLCELCRLFFDKNWVIGTGGGMSIIDADNKHIYVSPSSVQKERMVPGDLYVLDASTNEVVRKPVYKLSACTPIFKTIYHNFQFAKSVIHTHSQNAVMVSLLYDKEFRIKNMEQIKAFPKLNEPGYLDNYDELVIPIIENEPYEQDLEVPLNKLFKEYPHTVAVIVRRHGLFVWGENVWKAKIYNESLDYLFELAIKMKSFGIPPTCAIGEEKKFVDPKVYN